MKHIVFILSAYYPRYSAVAYCCESVIQVLKQNYKVTVICLKSNLSAPKVDTRGSIDIINVSTAENDRRLYLESSESIFLKFRLLLHRIHSVFKRVVAPTSINRELVDAYWKALQEIKLPIDAIIPAIFPMEGAVAASYHKQKNPNISIYPYVFDDFVESDSLHVHSLIRFLKKQKNKIVEYEIYRTSEKILSMHSRKTYHDINLNKELNSKIIYLEHPLLVEKENEQNHDNVTRLVFAGSLIRNIREPHFVIKLLKKVRCGNPLQIHFVTQGNLANTVKNFSEESNLYIINHGQLNKMETDQILASADILLSIGNIKSKQIPGKVFEYMALGKPIIHFVNDVPDYTYWVLKKYPYAISILKDYAPIQVNIKIVQQFIQKNQNKRITFAETAKIFPEALPDHTVKVIQSLISP